MSELHMVINIWSGEDNNPVYTLLTTDWTRWPERGERGEGEVRVRQMNWQLNIQGSVRRPNGLTGATTSWSYEVRKISDALKSPSSCGMSQEDDWTPESSQLHRFELLFFVFVLSLISVKKTESVFSWTVGAGRVTSSIMNCAVILILTSSCLTWSSAMYTPSRAGRVWTVTVMNK